MRGARRIKAYSFDGQRFTLAWPRPLESPKESSMSGSDAARAGIRGGLVPLGLGLLGGHLSGYVIRIQLLDLVAAYIVGAVCLGAIALGVWLWNLLDLLGVPLGASIDCPRCGGTGKLGGPAACPSCDGRGTFVIKYPGPSFPCQRCGGTGTITSK